MGEEGAGRAVARFRPWATSVAPTPTRVMRATVGSAAGPAQSGSSAASAYQTTPSPSRETARKSRSQAELSCARVAR